MDERLLSVTLGQIKSTLPLEGLTGQWEERGYVWIIGMRGQI